MVEQNVILKRLVLLEEYLSDLDDAKKSVNWDQLKNDKVTRRYVERTLHMAVEACLDIANHLISYEGFREPTSNKDCFQILSEKKIIPESLVDNLKKMAQFRNVIVHDYIRIQPEIVYAILNKHIEDIISFGKIIKHKYIV